MFKEIPIQKVHNFIFRALFLSLQKKNMTIFLALIDEYQQRGCLDRVIKSLTET